MITGASSGIGKATAWYFQKKGWRVAATMRNPENEKELSQLDGVQLFRLDVQDADSIRQAVESAIKVFGRIDVLVNNAGYGTLGPFEASTPEQVERQFDVNVLGLMRVTREILPHFRHNRSGTIINISSIGGRTTFPLYSLYHGTKWAVEGFSESLQYELRPLGIRVRLIEPGAIKTDFYTRSVDVLRREGLNDYDDLLEKLPPFYNRAGEKAPGPEIVARKIYRAAISRSWRLRYPVGKERYLVLLPRKWMPESWYFAMTRKALKIK